MPASLSRRLIIAEGAADVALNDIEEGLKGGLERQEVGDSEKFSATASRHCFPLA